MSKKASVEIFINDEQAKARFEEIQAELKQIKVLKDKAFAMGDVKGFNQLNTEMKKLTREANAMQKKVIDVDKVLSNLKTASIKDLRDALRKANQELSVMSRNDPAFDKKRRQIMLLDQEIQKSVARAKVHGGMMDKLAHGFNKYFTMATAMVATLTGIAFSAKEWVKGLMSMDDALANVMKTTGLTRKEVRELYTEFANLNTRTPRMELLELAEEAGRLGKKSKKDVMDFVEVGNMIKVALGDDLKGNAAEAIKEVGKLSNIYKIGEKYGTDFRKSMLMVGSAINEVSANSQAQAPYLIDMLKRMGGLADQADIGAQSVIGIASALDQLGQTSEVSGTAINKTIINMFTDVETYAGIARMSVSDFSKLLQTDANEAFIKFLEGLNGNNEGLTVMAQKFDGLGLDGARAIQVLAALASNTEMVRKEQALANDALIKATSLTNEYNIKNNNMAGNIEKIGQAIRKWFVNSTMNKSLEGIVANFAALVEVPVERKLQAEGREVAQLVGQLTNANTKAGERLAILEKLKGINPDIVEGLEAEYLNYDTLGKNLRTYNTELAARIVMEKLNNEEQESLTKIAEKKAKALEEELNMFELMGKLNPDILAQQGTISEKVQAIIEYYEKLGITAEGANRTMQMAGAGQINVATEQEKMLDDLVTALTRYNNNLSDAAELESNVVPLQKRIEAFRQMLGLNTEIVVQTENGNKGLTQTIDELTRINNYIAKNKQAFEDWKDKGVLFQSVISLIRQEIEAVQKIVQQGDLLPDLTDDTSGLDFLSRLMAEQKLKADQLRADGLISQDLHNQMLEDMEVAHLITLIELRKKTGQDTLALEQQLAQMRINQRNSENEQDYQIRQEWRNMTIDIAQTAADAIFQINAQRIDAEMDLELSKLDRQREAELKNKKLTEEQKDAINEKYRKNEAKIRLDAWKKQKQADLISSIIKTALAVVSALPNVPLSIAAGVAGAAQTAVIAAQKAPQFYHGGYTRQANSNDEPAGIVHANEFVANHKAVQNPTVKPVLDMIDRAQRSGAISSINLPAVLKVAQFKEGGYTSLSKHALAIQDSEHFFSNYMDVFQNAFLVELAKTTDNLKVAIENLSQGVKAELVYQDYKRMADKETTAINRTA